VTLPTGTKLGPYEIIAHVGAGGMGEVYRANDTRLNRAVAVKILPTHLSGNPEFRQRFEREAQTVSSLNHAHICQLFDVGSQDGTDFLVMEFLDGETLAERLRKGALPLHELLKIGVEVAAALETAHRAAIVHRDLKPGNIMLTKSGAKLMDFGLAKPAALVASASGSAPLLSAARTMSGASPVSPLTTAGSIVGTIQYMSPEQIEGKEADARADIFAFGAVLYEMATGKRAFEGKSQISVASSILEKDPQPVSEISPLSPAAFDYLVATCLAKDREDRIQSAHDVLLQLKGISQSAKSAEAIASSRSGKKLPRVLWAASALLALIAVALSFFAQRTSAPMISVRSYIPPPSGTAFRASGFDAGPVVVSPDGTTLAFSAVDEKGKTSLWLRPLSAQQATVLPGTEDAAMPFWSPDSQYVGFVAAGKLKRISVSGGEAQALADGATGDDYTNGADWNAEGTILFCKKNFGPIYRVAASGGEVSQATKPRGKEVANSYPSFLPDGKHFFYVAWHADRGTEIEVGVLGKTDQEGTIIGQGDSPRYASGHLLFVRNGHILAQKFDPETLKLSGDTQVLGEAQTFSVSLNGVLAYHESSGQSELKIFDRSGNVITTPGPMAAYQAPRFSPDGRFIAVTVGDSRTAKSDIWIYPVAEGQPTRMTFGPENFWPVWSPDGREIAYAGREKGTLFIRHQAIDGTKPEETVYKTGAYLDGAVLDWSPDGKYLSLDLMAKDGAYSNWTLPLQVNREPFRPAATANLSVNEYDGLISPDARWLTYFSYESGRPEVYVVPFAANGAKTQVSTTGGWLPRFRKKELFFLTMGNRLMSAPIEPGTNFKIGTPRPLFQLDLPNFAGPHYDVSADGQRFVVLATDHTKSTSITLFTGWTSQLKK
jgi:serine/threonine protein kinase